MTSLRTLLLCATLGLAAACGREPQPVAQDEAPEAAAAPAPAPVPTVTEAQVRELAAAAEAAVGRFDTHALNGSLAEDVRFVAIPPPTFGPTLKIQGRDRVIAQIDAGLSNAQHPSYSSRIGELKMAADGTSGSVDYAAVTSYTMDRHAVVEQTTDTYTVMIRNGTPKVVAMNQTATGLSIDGDKRF
jgi:hypothetical protein